jgi:hypothetical protein
MTMTSMHRVAVLFLLGLSLLLLAPHGASATPGASCGGFVGNALCDAKREFCQHPAGACARFPLLGICVSRPRVCPRIYRPVCGCNGRTYANDCVRMSAGVSKLHDGRCTRL